MPLLRERAFVARGLQPLPQALGTLHGWPCAMYAPGGALTGTATAVATGMAVAVGVPLSQWLRHTASTFHSFLAAVGRRHASVVGQSYPRLPRGFELKQYCEAAC